eukprot:403367751
MERSAERKITPLFIKTFAQKFDLNTIFLLDLSKKQINAIGSIPECTNLLMLDLSYNNLSGISGIEALVNLKHLNLSFNKLTQIDALKSCVALEKIELQGNQIRDLRTLETVGPSLVNIKVIYLQEFNFQNPNPVCSVKNYRKKVFEGIPKLKALDGHRDGIPVIEQQNLDDGGDQNVEYKVTEDWFTPEIFLSNPGKNMFQTAPQTTKEEQSLRDALRDCDSLLNRKTNVLTL